MYTDFTIIPTSKIFCYHLSLLRRPNQPAVQPINQKSIAMHMHIAIYCNQQLNQDECKESAQEGQRAKAGFNTTNKLW